MTRDRLILFAVLVAAAALAALLVQPHRPREPEEPTPAETAASAAPAPAPRPTAKPKADAGPPPLPDYVRIDPRSREACGEGMVLVDGVYCPFVGHRCQKYLNESLDVCQSYGPDVVCEGQLQHRTYCVDVFEYPNLEGLIPAVMTDWHDAERACAVEEKRLCTVEEWEFACEGPQMWPYPYGTERDPLACSIDRTLPVPDFNAFADPWKISAEVARLDQRVPSGAFPRCISPFGVRDMTGNVDEWVDNKKGKIMVKPFRSSLKGGYWGPIRARCRPMTSSHNERFAFYQVGFRCCRDAKIGAPVADAPGAHVPRVHRMADPPARPTP